MIKQKKEHYKTKLPEGWKTSVATTFEEIEAIRPIWEKMHQEEHEPKINANTERYLAIVEPSKKKEVQPYIITLFHNDKPEVMVIGWIVKHKIECKIGYLKILKPSLRCLSIVHGGILGQPSGETSARLLQEMIGILKRGDMDAVFFNQLRLDSAFYRLTRTMPSPFCRYYPPVVEPHWQTHLPDSIETFYKVNSGTRKRYLRRYTKALEKACSGPVEMACYRSEDKLDYVIEVASDISSRTYKHALNVGFRDDVLTRSLLSQAARQRTLRAYVLYAGGKPCAFEFGIEYGTVFFPEHIGYDPLLGSCSPGTVLFIKVLEDLIQNSDVRVFDYGFGAAVYKERFGSKSWQEASDYLFAPRFYPILVNMLRTCIASLDAGLKYALSKTGLADRIKRYWRNCLAQNTSKKEK